MDSSMCFLAFLGVSGGIPESVTASGGQGRADWMLGAVSGVAWRRRRKLSLLATAYAVVPGAAGEMVFIDPSGNTDQGV